jgi:hypothetical protein
VIESLLCKYWSPEFKLQPHQRERERERESKRERERERERIWI